MINIFKVTFKFNKELKGRGGRFLSVYTAKDRINGKVLHNNILFARVQRARDGKIFYVKNWSISFVVADHKLIY
jgi:hypothetical protein